MWMITKTQLQKLFPPNCDVRLTGLRSLTHKMAFFQFQDLQLLPPVSISTLSTSPQLLERPPYIDHWRKSNKKWTSQQWNIEWMTLQYCIYSTYYAVNNTIRWLHLWCHKYWNPFSFHLMGKRCWDLKMEIFIKFLWPSQKTYTVTC